MAISFAVDDVQLAPAPPTTVPAAQQVGPHVACALPADLAVLPISGVPPLLAAVHHAFAEHRPLVLSPDAVWLTIAAGVAQHVRLHADDLRHHLVRHDGRKTLSVPRLSLPRTEAEWAETVSAFTRLLRDESGSLARLFACDFSTSTEVERVAGEIILLDALSPYFEYLMTIICGIPQLTLTGTPADWRELRTRVELLGELGLAQWVESLIHIADQLVAAAEGRPDLAFFRQIYKPQEAYGADLIGGWIARLYPYVRDGQGSFSRPNPLLAWPISKRLPKAKPGRYFDVIGIHADDAPAGPSAAVLYVQGPQGQQLHAHELVGGLMVVAVRPDGALEPRAGWLVRPPVLGTRVLLHELRSHHQLVEAAPATAPRSPTDLVPHQAFDPLAAHPDARELFARVEHAVLFADTSPWRILPRPQRQPFQLGQGVGGPLFACPFIELPDGSLLATAATDMPAVLRLRPGAPIAHSPVVGASLLELLEGALRSGGALPTPDPLAPARTLIDVCSAYRDGWEHAQPLVERLRSLGHRVELDPVVPGQAWYLPKAIVSVELRLAAQPWRLVSVTEREHVSLTRAGLPVLLYALADLGDGTLLAQHGFGASTAFVRVRKDLLRKSVLRPGTADRPAITGWSSDERCDQVPMLGRSLVELLAHQLDHGQLPPPRPWDLA